MATQASDRARGGRFIAFEGIDGSGKSSTMERVATALRREGRDVVTTREETQTERGAWVRKAVSEGWDPIATTLLFVADRAVHAGEINAWLAAGKTVLCDRYVHSTYAYQSVTLAERMADPRAFLRRLHDGWCPMPDHVLLFRADPARCLDRVRKRGQATAYEKVEFLHRVQEAYLAEARSDGRIAVLEAERDIEAVGVDAIAQVKAWLAHPGVAQTTRARAPSTSA
ncbi:MAG: dTMP kinase [Thermoplasmata archaeon]|jgi:dTMP kinase|nr:dTMP kinase [Thermoplasmata archaeon]MEA3166224.1 dTMP kinase [Thermoplasmata archaeon]